MFLLVLLTLHHHVVLLQAVEHQQLLQHLGLAGLPELPRQEHLVNNAVHLQTGLTSDLLFIIFLPCRS